MECSITGCHEVAFCKKLCRKHYFAFYKKKKLNMACVTLYDLLPDETREKLERKRKRVVRCARCGKRLKYPDIVLLNFVKKVCKKCHKIMKEETNGNN